VPQEPRDDAEDEEKGKTPSKADGADARKQKCAPKNETKNCIKKEDVEFGDRGSARLK